MKTPLAIVCTMVGMLTTVGGYTCVSQYIPHNERDNILVAQRAAEASLASDARPFLALYTYNGSTGWTMDVFSGLATFWVYGFYSPSLDSAVSVTTYDIAGSGVVATAYPMAPTPFRLDTMLLPRVSYISSDVALSLIKAGPASQYFRSHSNSYIYYAMLFVDRNDGVFKWVFKFTDGSDSLSCAINATDGSDAGGCSNTTTTVDNSTPLGLADLVVWPNPASVSSDSYVFLEYASGPHDKPHAVVTDAVGRALAMYGIPNRGFVQFGMLLPISNIPPGVYFVTVMSLVSRPITRPLFIIP